MLSARNVENSRIVFDDFRWISDEAFEAEHARTRVEAGDVLLTIVGTIGRSAVVPEGVAPFSLQRSVAVLRARGLEPKYLMYQLQSPQAQRFLQRRAAGTAQKGVYLKALGELPVVVAPLPEQRRIVAALEERLSDLDAAATGLQRARVNVERYCSAVLEQAIRPSLARESTWTSSTLANLARESGYGTSQRCSYDSSGPPVLRIPNIVGGRLDYTDLKFAWSATEFSDSDVVDAGDLLIVRTNGSRNLIGRGVVVTEPPPGRFYFASYLIRYRLSGEPWVWNWIRTIWHSPTIRRTLESMAASTAGQYNLSVAKLDALPIRIPERDEAEAIIREVDHRLAIANRTAAEIDTQVARAARLRQSILKQAFEGCLVPQDPNDEPAAVLLERIRAERNGAAASRRPTGTGRRKLSARRP